MWCDPVLRSARKRRGETPPGVLRLTGMEWGFSMPACAGAGVLVFGMGGTLAPPANSPLLDDVAGPADVDAAPPAPAWSAFEEHPAARIVRGRSVLAVKIANRESGIRSLLGGLGA